MIRHATIDDVARLVELGATMHAESPRFRKFAYLPDRVAGHIETLLTMPRGLVLVADLPGHGVVGGILALAVQHYACAFLQASDLAFFVHPDHRGGTAAPRLLDGYRKWAASLNAEANVQLNTGVQPERTAQLLAVLGAEQTGTIWTWGTT